MEINTVRQFVLVIISGDPKDAETARFCQLIKSRALHIDADFSIMRTGPELDQALSENEPRFTHIFVLGRMSLEPHTVNFLLNNKWRKNPMCVVAVIETGAGALYLRARQSELLGVNFDLLGLLTTGTELALDRLLPYPVGA
jgi:hypothetical protein